MAAEMRARTAIRDVDVLHAVCHAFGSTVDPTETAQATVRWVTETLAPAGSAVWVSLPDRAGRLRVAASRVEDGPSHRVADHVRRAAFSTKRHLWRNLATPPGWRLSVAPMVSRGEVLGVVEMAAPAEILAERWVTIEAVLSQGAIVLRSLRERAALERDMERLLEDTRLTRTLLRAGTPRAQARAILSFCARRFGAPVAGWAAGPDPARLEIIGGRRLGARRLSTLHAELPAVGRWRSLRPGARRRVMTTFAAAAGASEVAVLQAGDLLILLGGPPADLDGQLAKLAGLIDDCAGKSAARGTTEPGGRPLDMGLAWTAHELRAPLLAAKAAMERLLMRVEDGAGTVGSASDRDLLRWAQEELDQLAQQVEGLLRWGVGEERLDRADTDLVHVVRQAVWAAAQGDGAGRVSISAPSELPALVDGPNLRLAIVNVIRNALAYSPPGSSVLVAVTSTEDSATISVRDQGTGVPADERDRIFDPFVRGGSGRARNGHGLGLFIARRVVEAHGGTIDVASNGHGSTFHIEIPEMKPWSMRAFAS